jgi:hypothetical protein
MRKFLFIYIVLFSCVINGCATKTTEFASVTFFMGDVFCNGRPVEIGLTLKQNDVLKTSDLSFCDIKLGGSLVRIKVKSDVMLSFLSANDGIEDVGMELGIGKILCKPKKLLKSEKFVVKTHTAVAGVRGTSFIVEADRNNTTRIKVFDGMMKVSKRVKQLDDYTDEVIDAGSVIEQEKKVVITETDLKAADKAIEKAVSKTETDTSEAYLAIIEANRHSIQIGQKEIQKFSAEDFQKDNTELIAVQERPDDVVKKIAKVINEQKVEPQQPNTIGHLLLTRYEIYFVKGGKVAWEGRIKSSPVKDKNKIYIAADGNIFCAAEEGPVFWRKNIPGASGLELKGNRLFVSAGTGKYEIDMETGERIKEGL